MKAKLRFFGKEIVPSCDYCHHSVLDGNKETHCAKNKAMTEHGKCKHFSYAPQKRKPKSPLFLPKYSEDEFKL